MSAMALSRLTVSVCVLLGSTLGLAQTPDQLVRLNSSFRDLTRRVSPAVVEVNVVGYGLADDTSPDDALVGTAQLKKHSGNGSGVVVDPDGYIVTNAHVIDHAVAVSVVVGAANDGSRAAALRSAPARTFDAHVVGEDRDTDLALLKIDAAGLPALEFGDSDTVAQGDIVLAIGSPMLLRNSVSMGVVSAPARALGEEDPVLYIQTDAALNPGASGGALVDVSGEVIGLVTSILSKSGGNEGIGFAIPGNLVQSVFRQLRDSGTVVRGSLGLTVQTVTPSLARALSLRVQHGVLVTDMESDGAGTLAGFARKDVILSLDGGEIQTARQFKELIYGHHPGASVHVNVERGEEAFSLTAKVKGYPAPSSPLALTGAPEDHLISRLGIFCVEIDPTVAEALPDLRTQYGLVVVARSSDSAYASLDLKTGDVIHELNNLPIASIGLFREHIDRFRSGASVALQIERNGHLRYTAFEIQ